MKSVGKKAINTSSDTDIYMYMWTPVYACLLYLIKKPTHPLENICLGIWWMVLLTFIIPVILEDQFAIDFLNYLPGVKIHVNWQFDFSLNFVSRIYAWHSSYWMHLDKRIEGPFLSVFWSDMSRAPATHRDGGRERIMHGCVSMYLRRSIHKFQCAVFNFFSRKG